MTSAKIIADSISPEGSRITTMQVKFHRMVLAEFNTHRVFSRNFSSSRAIPTKTLLSRVANSPAMPVWWGKNQAGMQALEEFVGEDRDRAIEWWNIMAEVIARGSEWGAAMGIHKQLVNRPIEPFLYVEGIVTSTDWQNFFDLRCHPDAQPEIQALALKMRDALEESNPIHLEHGQWHTPYVVGNEDYHERVLGGKSGTIGGWWRQKVSAARCCRVSYLKHDGTHSTLDEDLALFDKLAGSVPIHASPLEHQAQCVAESDRSLSRNFSGNWAQFRALWEQSLV